MPTAHRTSSIGDLVERAKSEYWEMPGLSLTAPQAARLWHISLGTAETVLGSLVGAGFLVRRDHGTFVLASGSPLHAHAGSFASRAY